MNALCKRIIIAFQLILASALSAQAGPSPAIVISDFIIGTTPTSFFVIRTTTFNGPTYYQYSKRIDFVELSIRDGSIVQKCAQRETEYASDAAVDRETWTPTEKRKPSCQVFDLLSKRSAGYITPRSTDTGKAAFRLTANGLEARADTSDDNARWTNVMPTKLIKVRAAKTTSVMASEIPWQTSPDPFEVFSLAGAANDTQPLHELCKLDPVALTSRGHHAIFLHLSCWSGDTDADGANFYIAWNDKH
ncbi:MAG: hypothetical protein ABJM26_17705 [Anderseniella sp.]